MRLTDIDWYSIYGRLTAVCLIDNGQLIDLLDSLCERKLEEDFVSNWTLMTDRIDEDLWGKMV